MNHQGVITSEKEVKRRLLGIYGLMMLFCTLLFVLGLAFVFWHNLQQAEEDFNQYSNEVHQSLFHTFTVNETILDGFAAYLAGEGINDLERARYYARTMMGRYTHLYMFQAARRVPSKDVPKFEREMSDQIGDEIKVKRFVHTKGMIPADPNSGEEYYPVVFVEPIFNNGMQTLGLDILSIQFTKEAMEMALAQGLAAVSRPIGLYDGSTAFVMVKPSFKPGVNQVSEYALVVVKTEALAPDLRPEEEGYTMQLLGMGSEFLLDVETESLPIWQQWIFPELVKEEVLLIGAHPLFLRITKQMGLSQINIVLILILLVLTVALAVALRLYMRMHMEAEKLKAKANRRLYHQANYDQLTGLANRHHFEAQFEHVLMSAQRRKERVGFLYIDLNDFKYINDTYGHQVGDKVLAIVGSIIQGVVRINDIPSRFGGDEFVVCLEDVHTEGDAIHVVERLREGFAEVGEIDGIPMHITASIGLSIFPEEGDSLEKLMRSADKKMYADKLNKNTPKFSLDEN